MDICYWWAPMSLGPSGFLCAGPSAMLPSWPPKAAIPSQLNCSSGNDCSQHTSNFISELLLASLPTMVRSASACSCNNASEHPEMAYCCGGDASVMLSSAMVIWPLFLMGTKEVLCSHLLYTSQRNQLLFFFLSSKKRTPLSRPLNLLPQAWRGCPCRLPHPESGASPTAGPCLYCLHMLLGNRVLKSSDKVALLFPMALVQRGRLAALWVASQPTGSPSTAVQLGRVSSRVPETVVSFRFLQLRQENACILAAVTNKLQPAPDPIMEMQAHVPRSP